jgi:hypothetical protein
MYTFELKFKTLSEVPQGDYICVLSKWQQQGPIILSAAVQERFRVLLFVQILWSANFTRPVDSVIKFMPSIQIP